jgi:hypothetical protein
MKQTIHKSTTYWVEVGVFEQPILDFVQGLLVCTVGHEQEVQTKIETDTKWTFAVKLLLDRFKKTPLEVSFEESDLRRIELLAKLVMLALINRALFGMPAFQFGLGPCERKPHRAVNGTR